MDRRAVTARLKLVAVILFVAALLVYAFGIMHSVYVSDRRAQQKAVIEEQAQMGPAELAREAKLAEAYWRRYPDVAADDFFGRDGLLGVHGPREHFDRHGRAEGREWPRQ